MKGASSASTLTTGELAYAVSSGDLSGDVDLTETRGTFEGEEIAVPYSDLLDEKRYVLGTSNESRWIEVDLSEQKLRAWEGTTLFLETLVSTGLRYTPTPQGEFRIWYKTRATKMSGGSGKNAYYLPNVPYTMFFEGSGVPGWKGYGLHGTYWHSDFGTQRSHGCVNLPTEIAKRIYDWVSPEIPDGKSAIRASAENLGTRVVIHE
jgi:hypothetical protein